MKKKLAVLLCSSANEAFAIGNVMIGIKERLVQNLNENDYDIIFYTDNLDIQDELAIKKIHKNVIIKKYNSRFSKNGVNGLSAELGYFTVFAFARYEAFHLLGSYEKVFYGDSDIIIQKDISQILNTEDIFSIVYFVASMPISNNFSKEAISLVKGYNLTGNSAISAVFLASDKIKNYENITDWCYKKTEEYKTNDQAILNLAILEFEIETNNLGESYGCYPNSPNADDADIIHAIGRNKFWRGTHNDCWQKNYETWLLYGGNSIEVSLEITEKKKKLISKIVWFIPFTSLRNKIRYYLSRRYGVSAR